MYHQGDSAEPSQQMRLTNRIYSQGEEVVVQLREEEPADVLAIKRLYHLHAYSKAAATIC